ncbi:MAG: MBL fold metallo-hydrolase [Ilumatobacteraceae bacterium]
MELFDYARQVIDARRADGPVNRITNELTEVAEDLAVVESFSHVWIVRTEEGLVLFDTSGERTAGRVVEALRSSSEPVHTLVYTHGHIDHVGGAGAFLP